MKVRAGSGPLFTEQEMARSNRRRRMLRFGAVLGVMATYALGAVTMVAWDGTNSTATLSYREAIQIMRDPAAPLARRANAARSIYALTLDAADAFCKHGRAVESYAGECDTWRNEISRAWIQ